MPQCLLLAARLNNIDLFPAGMAETPVDGGQLGPTFACIIGQQFSNMKMGDRYFYSWPRTNNSPQQAHRFTSGVTLHVIS